MNQLEGGDRAAVVSARGGLCSAAAAAAVAAATVYALSRPRGAPGHRGNVICVDKHRKKLRKRAHTRARAREGQIRSPIERLRIINLAYLRKCVHK